MDVPRSRLHHSSTTVAPFSVVVVELIVVVVHELNDVGFLLRPPLDPLAHGQRSLDDHLLYTSLVMPSLLGGPRGPRATPCTKGQGPSYRSQRNGGRRQPGADQTSSPALALHPTQGLKDGHNLQSPKASYQRHYKHKLVDSAFALPTEHHHLPPSSAPASAIHRSERATVRLPLCLPSPAPLAYRARPPAIASQSLSGQ